MSAIYAWLLLLLLSPDVSGLLPDDTFSMVDPMDPMASSLFVDALFEDIPEGVVTDLCLVESGGCKTLVGGHPRDRNVGRRVLRRAWEKGLLSRWCPFHWGLEPWESSTRGNHGQIVVYALHHLGPCLPVEVLDVPLYSALRAGLRARKVCDRKYNRQTKEIRRGDRALRDPCTSEDVRLNWAGGARDPDAVLELWYDRVDFWRVRARWRTDWRTRCSERRVECSADVERRPTLDDFRRKASGRTMRW